MTDAVDQISVRCGAVSDIPSISNVGLQSWMNGFAGIFSEDLLNQLSAPDLLAERLMNWQSWFKEMSADEFILVAEADGDVIGYVHGGRSEDDSLGEMVGLYVAPGKWGLGAGTALMTAGGSELATRGFTEAVLWVFEKNTRAQLLYERLGWLPQPGVTRQRDFFGEIATEVAYRCVLVGRLS